MTDLCSWRVAATALSLILLAACGNGTETTTPDPTTDPSTESAVDTPDPTAAPAGDAPSKIDITAVRDTAKTAMFVPAPTEFQAALEATEVRIDLKKVLKDSGSTLTGKSRSIIALETGVRLANVLMTSKEGDKATTLTRMRSAREGLVALDVPAGVLTELDRVIKQFEDGTLLPEELSPALDVLAGQLQEDLNNSTDPNTATLVQAGGWVQGAHLLSTSLVQAGQAGDAAALLNQPTVLAHFTDFLNKSGAGDPSVDAVLREMAELEELAGKDTLTTGDLVTISTRTAAIMTHF